MLTASNATQKSLNDEDIATLLVELQTLNYEQSALKLTQLANLYTSDARVLLLLAGEHAQAGKMDLAEASFLSALQCEPHYAIARFQLGLLQFTSARPAVASVTWAPLDDLPENDPLRLFKTGFEYLAQNKTAEATHAIELGIHENKSNAPLNTDMRKVLTAIEGLSLLGNTSTPAPSQPTDIAAPEEATEHFLMSAYRNLH
jgi:tetratricopeptide (TPR) repeat protein